MRNFTETGTVAKVATSNISTSISNGMLPPKLVANNFTETERKQFSQTATDVPSFGELGRSRSLDRVNDVAQVRHQNLLSELMSF